jgi:uncharacterized protein YndB with AHSA1/START domain
MLTPITIETVVNAPVEKAWQYWNEPAHITQWAFASDDWECPRAEADLRVGGNFLTAMGAKDKSFAFEITGTFTAVTSNALLEYVMADGRHVKVVFTPTEGGTRITETFDPENENPMEMQRDGWQSILNNFKKHVEA